MSHPQEDIAEKSKIIYEVDEYNYLLQYRVELLNTSKIIKQYCGHNLRELSIYVKGIK